MTDQLTAARLAVRPGRNWRGQPGWEWVCPPCPEHRRRIRGFSHRDTWTDQPPAQGRAMDGARRHLHRYHQDAP